MASAMVSGSPGSTNAPAPIPFGSHTHLPTGSSPDRSPVIAPATVNALDDEAEDFVHAALCLMDSLMDLPDFT